MTPQHRVLTTCCDRKPGGRPVPQLVVDAQSNDIVPWDVSDRGPRPRVQGMAFALPPAVGSAEQVFHLGLEDGLRLARAGDLGGILDDHGAHGEPGRCRESTSSVTGFGQSIESHYTKCAPSSFLEKDNCVFEKFAFEFENSRTTAAEGGKSISLPVSQ